MQVKVADIIWAQTGPDGAVKRLLPHQELSLQLGFHYIPNVKNRD